jgi:iron complex outermembrane receptor protein
MNPQIRPTRWPERGSRAVAWACALMLSAMCLPAPSAHAADASNTAAATAATAATADDALPALSVTGTALRRIDAETALPVTVIRRAEIERSGARDLAELLQRLPAMQGFAPATTVTGNDSHGYTSFSLHDLGDIYTLVLVNGQRVTPFGGQGANGGMAGVDAQTLPLAMIERIEVLTDGASALYGADALGGVVNLITRRDGDANEATAGWRQAKGGARTWSLSAFKGVGDLAEQGQTLALGVSASRQSALPATARSYARNAQADFMLNGQRVRYSGGDFWSAPGQVYVPSTGAVLNTAGASGACPTGQYLNTSAYGTPLCYYNYAADLMLIPAQHHQSAMASYTRQVGEDAHWMVDALWSQSTVWSQLAPISTGADALTVPADSPAYLNHIGGQGGLGVSDDPVYAYTRLVDLGPRRQRDTSTLLHLASRADGHWVGLQRRWDWQAGALQSSSHQVSHIAGFISHNGAQSLVASGFNPFVPAGQQSASGLAALRHQAYAGPWTQGDANLQGLHAQASTTLAELPAGPLRWALGADWRQESLHFNPGAFAQGLLADVPTGATGPYADGQLSLSDSNPVLPVAASRRVWGAFSEWLVPLHRSPDGQRWEAGAALRGDHDDRVGGAVTGKLHTRWQVTPALMWRASMGTGFRTPTLGQLVAPQQSQGQTGSHACTPALQALATRLGATPCDPSVGDGQVSYTALTQGNAQLKPEHSQQASIGLRIEPLAGHSIGLDWWTVRIQDQIGVPNEGASFDSPLAFPAGWTRQGDRLVLLAQPHNINSRISSGVDLDASVRRGSRIGLVETQLRLSTLLRETEHLYPGAPWTSSLGDGLYGAPSLRWRAQWRTTLVHAGWTHSLTARYQSGYTDAPVTLQVLDAGGQATGNTVEWRAHIPRSLRWDWQTQWQLDAQWQLSLGIENVFNRRPPTSWASSGPYKAQIIGYDERFFDPQGRVWALQMRLSF